MLIPMLCQSCGRPVGHDDWFEFLRLVKQYQAEGMTSGVPEETIDVNQETAENRALRDLRIVRDCCRISFLCTMDLTDEIS